MASESTPSKPAVPGEASEDWQKKEGLGRFARDVLIAAAILGGALFFYRSRVETGKNVRELGKHAKEMMLKDSPKAYGDAEAKLLDIIKLDAKYPFAVASLGELYAIRWVDLGLEDQADKAREWAGRADKLDARINERYGAVLLAKLGDKQFDAASRYGAEISKKAASSHVVNGYGRALRGLGKLDEARQALKKSADTEWRNPRFACDFADLYLEDGDFVNAENFYTKGVEANSSHPRSLVGQARARIARGQKLKEAAAALAEVLGRPVDELSPKLRSMALTGMAELRFFEKKLDEAQKAADEAVAAHGNNAWASFVRGKVLAAATAPGAAEAIEKAVSLDKYVPVFYYDGAAVLLEAGSGDKAVALLEAFAQALRVDDRYHLAYGELLRKLNKADEAVVQYDKAIEQNGFNAAAAHVAKATVLLEIKKDLPNAQKELETALALNEFLPAAHTRLGDIRFEKKEFQEGCEQYAQSIVQMKLLQFPRDRLNEVRETVNTRLVKANKREMAKMWMTESAVLIR